MASSAAKITLEKFHIYAQTKNKDFEIQDGVLCVIFFFQPWWYFFSCWMMLAAVTDAVAAAAIAVATAATAAVALLTVTYFRQLIDIDQSVLFELNCK